MAEVSEVQLDDVPCLSGTVDVPLPGAWTAEVTARGGGETFPPGRRVTLTVLGVQRVGTVVNGGAPDLRNVVRIKGGAGTLGKVLEASDYEGRDLAYVVGDVLRSAGESVGDLTALRNVPLAHWIRPAERASRALRRLLRLTPAGTFVRVLPDGSWGAVTPSWGSSGKSADDLRVQNYEAEDAVALCGNADLVPEPGTSLDLLGEKRRIDRVQWTWEEEDPAIRAVCWFRREGADQRDRFRAGVAKIVWEVLAEDGAADFGRLYAGRIARDTSGSLCEVFFEDDRNRVQYASNVRIRREVGDAVKWARGTRVLVGWDFGDERYPFAISASWSGGGGLIDRATSFSGEVSFDGPLVSVSRDLRAGHDLGGGAPPIVQGQGGPINAATYVAGADRRFLVQVVATNIVPPGTPMFKATFARPWGSLPMCTAQIVFPPPFATALGCLATPVDVTVSHGAWPIPLPVGTYSVVVTTGG